MKSQSPVVVFLTALAVLAVTFFLSALVGFMSYKILLAFSLLAPFFAIITGFIIGSVFAAALIVSIIMYNKARARERNGL